MSIGDLSSLDPPTGGTSRLFYFLTNLNTCLYYEYLDCEETTVVRFVMKRTLLHILLPVFLGACGGTGLPRLEKDCQHEAMDMSTSPPDLNMPPSDLRVPADLAMDPGGLPSPRIPGDFEKAGETKGVTVWKKPWPAPGTPDYVLIIDITKVDLQSVFGTIDPMNTRPTAGPYGGPDPLVTRWPMTEWQNRILGGIWFFTGQFFNPANNPTQIAYGITEPRVDMGRTVKHRLVDGADADPKWEKMLLEIWPGQTARILPFSLDVFKDTSRAPQVIVGLSENAPKAPSNLTGRTFIGAGTEVEKGASVVVDYRLLYVFVSEKSTQLDAGATLRKFGAVKTMMLDGGGSVKLFAAGQVLANGGSATPHVLALYPRP